MSSRTFSQPQNKSFLKLNISNNGEIIPKLTSYLTPIKNNTHNYYDEGKKIYSASPNLHLRNFNYDMNINYNNNINYDNNIYNRVINKVFLYSYPLKNKNYSAPIKKNKINNVENNQIKPFTLDKDKDNLKYYPNYKYQMNSVLLNEMKRSYSSNNYFNNKNDNYENLNYQKDYNYNYNNMIYSNRTFQNIRTRRNSENLNSNLLNSFNKNFNNNQVELNNNLNNMNNYNKLNKNINPNLEYSNNNSNYFDYFNNNSYEFDLEKSFILENKILEILTNLNKHQPIYNECNDWINYYFNENIYYYYLSLCKNKKNKEKLLHTLKIELLNYCLCYYIFYNKKFDQYIGLAKLIFEEIYYNSLIYIKLILKNTNMNNDNYIWYQNLHNKIKNEPTLNFGKTLYENDMIKLLNQSIKSICYHYKKLIDLICKSSNIKKNNNKDETFIKNNEKILSFFKDFSFIENHSIEDIYDFFKLNIYNIIDPNGEYILFDNIKNQNKNFRTYNNFYLPQNNSINTYTLVLDLDETLIYLQRDSNIKSKRKTIIYRPYLIEFLQKMKKLYELILFSLGTPEYVDSIVETIERKERFFQYRLYRQHGKIYGNEIIKDLSKIGRDIKKIIIVDNMPQSFKLQKKNGICIKGFYGNLKDETLKDLSNILEKIRYDVNYTNDIRISLLKEKPSIILKITS